jgi:hypothetical protein
MIGSFVVSSARCYQPRFLVNSVSKCIAPYAQLRFFSDASASAVALDTPSTGRIYRKGEVNVDGTQKTKKKVIPEKNDADAALQEQIMTMLNDRFYLSLRKELKDAQNEKLLVDQDVEDLKSEISKYFHIKHIDGGRVVTLKSRKEVIQSGITLSVKFRIDDINRDYMKRMNRKLFNFMKAMQIETKELESVDPLEHFQRIKPINKEREHGFNAEIDFSDGRQSLLIACVAGNYGVAIKSLKYKAISSLRYRKVSNDPRQDEQRYSPDFQRLSPLLQKEVYTLLDNALIDDVLGQFILAYSQETETNEYIRWLPQITEFVFPIDQSLFTTEKIKEFIRK